MKKIVIFLALIVLSAFVCPVSYGAVKNDTAEIKALLNNVDKYSNEHNVEELKKYYSKDYISSDGFTYDAFFVSINDTFKSYPDISYKSKIKSINVSDKFATVEVFDVSTSERQTETQAIVDNKPVFNHTLDGVMESRCHYVIYLKKTGGKWLIYSDNVISEETSIKYGAARNLDLDIVSPQVVTGGQEYCISLNVKDKPKNSIMLASLSREEIKYPAPYPRDVFRKVPSDGVLERMVVANKNGINEYSLASVGITEISLNEEKTAINYKMAGIAFLMKRVNVNDKKNAVNKNELNKALEALSKKESL